MLRTAWCSLLRRGNFGVVAALARRPATPAIEPGAPDRRVHTMTWECLSLVVARPAPSPSCPSGKAEKFSGRREHRTPDHAVLPALAGTAVRSAPGRDRAESAVYSGISRQRKP